MKETEELPLVSIAASRPVERLCQTDFLLIPVFRFADGAGVYDAAVICVFVRKMHAAACRAVVAPGAEGPFVGIEVDPAWGHGQGIVDVLLLLAFELPVLVLQCRMGRFEIDEFKFQVGGVELRSGKLVLQIRDGGHKFGVLDALGHICDVKNFGTKGYKEIGHG